MALLQPRLSLKVSQRQILTPGLMQMVSVLALNKLDLKEMINAEIVENPVLEELEENVPLLDDIEGREAERDRPAEQVLAEAEREKVDAVDPFEEIDFGSYFQDYLDPGFRSPSTFEISEKPSFENFLSQASSLSDHLFWQLGSLSLSLELRDAAEYIIGNLDEDGYLSSSDEELLSGYLREKSASAESPAASQATAPERAEQKRALLTEALQLVRQLDPIGIATRDLRECLLLQIAARQPVSPSAATEPHTPEDEAPAENPAEAAVTESPEPHPETSPTTPTIDFHTTSQTAPLDQLAPAAADEHLHGQAAHPPAAAVPPAPVSKSQPLHSDPLQTAYRIVDKHLPLLLRRDLRELARAAQVTVAQAQCALDLIRTLDPRPGQRYSRSEARLIEPDVAFVKRDGEYVVVMNEDDLPTLRLNHGYRRMLTQESTGKDVKEYVKERYRSAIQLIRNIEQRKNTILRTCEAIIRRQTEFLDRGVEYMKPMMIKEVAEEIGVHPSTVSRAVSNKYVHTAQGVFELRFFFSEGVNGPEGAGTPLMLLKRKVKKLIEDEDPRKPLTDDQIASLLQSQGIDVTRRTVAKYREDLRIPSTHQRRVRD